MRWTFRRTVLSLTAVAAMAFPVAAAADGVPAQPIPQDPGASSIRPFLGRPAAADPISATFAPRHPFMAPNDRSNLHDDAYQSDAGLAAGPLGHQPKVSSTLYTQECASVTFDAKGRLMTVCVGLATVDLRLLDPKTLDVIADYPLGARPPSSADHPFTAFGGGGYFYLDNHQRAVVPTSDGHIDVIGETTTPAGTQLSLVRQYDVSSATAGAPILSVLPDWHGRLWFVTDKGVVGFVRPATGAVSSRTLPGGETIGNSIAVDETGAVFVVSSRALYRFVAGSGPVVTWRKPYDAGTRQKPGQSQLGSGTTPTVIRRGTRHYVAITDNADPRMHVLVFRADGAEPGPPVCSMPVFANNTGSTDNSLIAWNRSIVVENNYGYTGPQQTPPSGDPFRNTPTTAPGVTRIDVDFAGHSCRKVWTAEVRVPSSVSKLSAATGLVYVYEHPSAGEVRYTAGQPGTGPEDPWYLTALDARTGRRVFSQLTGVGLGYNNNYAPITLGPDGSAYVATLGGLVKVTDSR